MSGVQVPILLVIIDRDRKCFNVIGPLVDDSEWTRKVATLRDQGRDVSCHDVRGWTRQQTIDYETKASGFAFTTDLID
jgi:hypothetical protein